MEHVYAPWRTGYVMEPIDGCVFCHIVNHPEKDEAHHVLYRDALCFIVMNKYPYTPGHFMVIPNTHIDNIEYLDEASWIRVSLRVRQGVKLLKEVFGVKGVNIGMNLGDCAGAGIAPHVHYHLVPRWEKDSNFFTTIANSRAYSIDFDEVYQRLKAQAPRYFGECE